MTPRALRLVLVVVVGSLAGCIFRPIPIPPHSATPVDDGRMGVPSDAASAADAHDPAGGDAAIRDATPMPPPDCEPDGAAPGTSCDADGGSADAARDDAAATDADAADGDDGGADAGGADDGGLGDDVITIVPLADVLDETDAEPPGGD